ncbi:hypothetical protein GCM10008935_02090 [Alkalibacillus silvisoli]|uniref:Uncharacterized protein n=1 Tax=Alkalibacillus silvisoli TaxID=392823 RepID=A0ABP3JHB1_9BACI
MGVHPTITPFRSTISEARSAITPFRPAIKRKMIKLIISQNDSFASRSFSDIIIY